MWEGLARGRPCPRCSRTTLFPELLGLEPLLPRRPLVVVVVVERLCSRLIFGCRRSHGWSAFGVNPQGEIKLRGHLDKAGSRPLSSFPRILDSGSGQNASLLHGPRGDCFPPPALHSDTSADRRNKQYPGSRQPRESRSGCCSSSIKYSSPLRPLSECRSSEASKQCSLLACTPWGWLCCPNLGLPLGVPRTRADGPGPLIRGPRMNRWCGRQTGWM